MKSELDDVIKRLRTAAELTKNQDGRVIDLAKERIFTGAPFLHQATENMTEEESAEFERKNKELFNFLRAFDDQLGDLF